MYSLPPAEERYGRAALLLLLAVGYYTYLRSEVARNVHERIRLRRVRVVSDDRAATISAFAYPQVQRYLAQEGHVVADGCGLRAAVTEQVGGAAAVRADEGAHVLHHAQDGH